MAACERVLLVEADSISNQLLSFSLQREGFEVIQAQSGPEGLRLARERAADVVLSEVLLPDMDGYEMCSRLRADWNTQRIPIVLVTSLGGTENRIRGLMAGADDYVMKPYDVRELVIRLRRLISTYSNCSQLNAITKLPGSQVIRSYVETVCLKDTQTDWAFLQIDLNNLKTYNHVYGFAAGDRVLREIGDMLRQVTLNSSEESATFVGHEGSDDFVATVPRNRVDAICRDLISEFDNRIADWYPPEDNMSTHHLLTDRTGDTQIVPHLTLSIGVVTSELCQDLNYLELREVATAVTNRAKSEPTSTCYVNRRRVAHRSLEAAQYKREKASNFTHI